MSKGETPPATPTHAGIKIADLQALIRYFSETPMPYKVSRPFMDILGAPDLVFDIKQAQMDAQNRLPSDA